MCLCSTQHNGALISVGTTVMIAKTRQLGTNPEPAQGSHSFLTPAASGCEGPAAGGFGTQGLLCHYLRDDLSHYCRRTGNTQPGALEYPVTLWGPGCVWGFPLTLYGLRAGGSQDLCPPHAPLPPSVLLTPKLPRDADRTEDLFCPRRKTLASIPEWGRGGGSCVYHTLVAWGCFMPWQQQAPHARPWGQGAQMTVSPSSIPWVTE